MISEWSERIRAQHADEVANEKHDNQCEWRETGFFICNCSKRKREASGYTTPPGELQHQYPLCPRCDDEVEHDGDSFVCNPCKTYWDPTDQSDEGTFKDDNGDLTEDVAKWDAQHETKAEKTDD